MQTTQHEVSYDSFEGKDKVLLLMKSPRETTARLLSKRFLMK
jgi:hypothetical protein